MKKRIMFSLAGLVLVCLAVAAVAVFLRSEPTAPRKESKVFPCVRIATVYAALAEKPEAKTVLLVGDEAEDYRPYFERAGAVCSTRGRGPFDIVFESGTNSVAPRSVHERSLAAGGVLAVCVDARELPAPRLWETLSTFPTDDFRFWMPGEYDWLVVGRRGKSTVKLSAVMDLFFREEGAGDLSLARCDSLPALFASYVGTKADVMPAFNGAVENVRADNFVTRRTPSLDWLETDGVDGDIVKTALSEIRSAQIVRRMVLAGNLYAARGNEEKSAETWARAARENPGDTFLVERLERLSVNAEVFFQLGKAAMAARCYETMAQIRPDDPVPVRKYGECLVKLGRKDVAARAFARADELEMMNRPKVPAKPEKRGEPK